MSGWKLGHADPDAEAVLAERLRLVAESLNAEFHGLSKADAERLVFVAAHDVLSSASVMQFVPTFAERRARSLLHSGYPVPETDATADIVDLTASAAVPPGTPRTPAPQGAPQFAVQEVPGPTPADAAGPLSPTTLPLAPPWPDDFYASEAKRLLARARDLRAASRRSPTV